MVSLLKKIYLIVPTLLACYLIFKVDMFKSSLPFIRERNCKASPFPAVGAQDIAQINDKSAIVSHSDFVRLLFKRGGAVLAGGLFVVKEEEGKVLKMKVGLAGFPEGVKFNPHGIHFHEGRLFVVNHSNVSGGGDRIEIFSFDQQKNEARYLRTIRFPPSMNWRLSDVTLIDNKRLFVSVWRPFPSDLRGIPFDSFLTEVKTLLYYFSPFRLQNVLECRVDDLDSQVELNFDQICRERSEISGIIPGGIASDDQNRLFIADTFRKSVDVYQINQDEIKHILTLRVDSLVVNLSYDRVQNSIYLTGVVRLKDFMRAAGEMIEEGINRSPNSYENLVQKIDLSTSDMTVETLISGAFIGSSTGAMRLGNTLLVGSLFDKLHECQVNHIETKNQ